MKLPSRSAVRVSDGQDKCPEKGVAASRRAGFTLTEMMVASTIFMLVSMAFSLSMLAALKTQYMAVDYYTATCIARNRVQHIRTKAFAQITNSVEAGIWVDSTGTTNAAGRYFRSTIISNVNSAMYAVKVRVTFKLFAGGQSEQPVEVETLISRDML